MTIIDKLTTRINSYRVSHNGDYPKEIRISPVQLRGIVEALGGSFASLNGVQKANFKNTRIVIDKRVTGMVSH